MTIRGLGVLCVAWMWGAVCAVGRGNEEGRTVLSLDGAWSFQTDPGDIGEKDGWFRQEEVFRGEILVPGCWDAQGVGEQTDKVRHNYVGVGWYRREILVPESWEGRRLFLCLQGVHRSAKVWVNETCLGEHVGYLSDFEYEVTNLTKPGKTCSVVLAIDSRQRWEEDTMAGCVDLMDAMDVLWGGIMGHVTLEGRQGAWMESFFVRSLGSRHVASAEVLGDVGLVDHVRLEIWSPSGRKVCIQEIPWPDPALPARVTVGTEIQDAALWSPDHPHLYRARLSLLRQEEVLDSLECRFGIREIRTLGPGFTLNGQPLFLRGYGDDAIYPETLMPPADESFYRARLRTIKSYGFNAVRHHSHFLPQEYYDACDEEGLLVQPELPIVYLPFYQRAQGPALDLYKSEWTSAITRLRNHPSILAWCMGNELAEGIPMAPELYRMAKAWTLTGWSSTRMGSGGRTG